jgi:HSP20 family protein
MYLTTFDPFALLERPAFGPAMPLDVVRHDDAVTMRFDVPGIDPASIDVTVDRGVLSVSARREDEPDGGRFFVRERTMGTFTRRVRLSDRLDADAVQASYANGVLEVRIPVLEQARPRKVEVTTADGHQQLAA